MKNNLSFPLARHARCATKANGRPDINSRIQQVTVDNNPAAPRWVNLSDLIVFFFFWNEVKICYAGTNTM